jgi:RND family efflux transporter MFP subunit
MMKPLNQRAIFAIRAAIALLLIVFALVIFRVLAGSGPILPTVDPDQQRQRVNVFTAQTVEVNRQWTGFGTAEAIDSANIPARVTATVDRIPPGTLEGAVVQEGQVIVLLDDSDFVNQLQVAEQNRAGVDAQIEELDRQEASLIQRRDVETRDLELARDELARIEDMFGKNAANQKDVDAADRTALAAERSLLLVEQVLSGIKPRRDQLLAQKAELAATADNARLNFERCSIKSPIDGVIQSVDVEVGESVAPGQRVARVVNTERIQTPLSLAANARSHVRVGDPAYLRSTADPGLTWEAEVKRISPEDDPDTRTFVSYVVVDQRDSGGSGVSTIQARLAPGVFVRGTVVASRSEDRVVVPRRSIRIERVMVVRDGVIQNQLVSEAYAIDGPIPETGLPDQEWAVLDNGVEPGEVVVLTPTRSLSDGQMIEPVMAPEQITATGAVEGGPRAQQGDAR